MTETESGEPATILWRRLDRPGHESARVLHAPDGGWRIDGAAVFAEEGAAVCLQYEVVCDSQWRSRSASVTGFVGSAEIHVQVTHTPDGQWLVNGAPQENLRGCVDLDLNFSPSTNLLPVRRLALQRGEEAVVRAAWLRFPSFQMEVLEQVYRRTGADTYEYESAGGSFRASIRVSSAGFPLEYAGLWQAESVT